MTSPEVDQELERLCSVARDATLPDAVARSRVRARLDERLAAGAGAAPARPLNRLWFGIGAAVVAVGGAGLWLSRAPDGRTLPLPATQAAVVMPSSATNAPPSSPSSLVEAAPAVEPALPEVAESTKLAERSRPATSARPSSVNSATSDPADEVMLVRAMQQALRSNDASKVLSLAAEHARRFPNGALVEEREGARAIASCQRADTQTRAAVLGAFTRRFGASPYSARVKAACQ